MAYSYQESLDYLYSLQLFGIKLGLHNIQQLLARVGNPQDSLRIIHIAGTNGKGSTAAALANIFQIANISAGLYTSPHLHNFSERIRIDTLQIDESEVVTLIEELRPHADALRATFFEVTTAMALLSFKRHGVAWAILETGLGGRLDATNVVVPELCAITPIDLDHTAYLGTELVQIATEKAGIIKAGVPLVCAPQDEKVNQILHQRASELGAPLIQLGREYSCVTAGDNFSVSGNQFLLENITPTLGGRHQHQNLALAAVVAKCLVEKGQELSSENIKTGLEQVCWPGRLEWLPQQILLDGAHNPAGALILANYLREQKLSNLHLVFGCKADKQSTELLGNLLPFVTHVYVTEPPFHPAVSADVLLQQVRDAGVAGETFLDPVVALQTAIRERQAGDVILVAGSLLLVAVAREFLLPEVDSLSITMTPRL